MFMPQHKIHFFSVFFFKKGHLGSCGGLKLRTTGSLPSRGRQRQF